MTAHGHKGVFILLLGAGLPSSSAPPPPPATPTLVNAPEISGTPQARQLWSIYGGEYSSTPTHYRYNLQRINPADGSVALTTTTTQAVEELHGTFLDADAYYGPGATVDVSFDGGLSYPISTAANVLMNYPTPVLLPWVIPDPTTAYSAGYVPGTFPLLIDIASVLTPSLRLLIKVEDSTLATLKYFGEMAIPESARSGSFTLDLSGTTDPAPDPALPALLATDIVSVQLATPDYQFTGGAGVQVGSASEWVAISPTAPAGRTKVRITNTNVSNAAWLPEIKVVKGGADLLHAARDGNPFFARCLRSSYDKANWTFDDNRSPQRCVGVSPYIDRTYLDNGGYFEFDFFTFDLTGATLEIHSVDPFAPLTDYTVTEYGPTGTLLRTITRTGLTYTANETKTETL